MRDKKHRLPSKSRTKVLVLAHMLLLAWAPIAHAHQLPFLMQERHLMVDLRMPIAGDQVDGMRIGYSVFNGDFPLLVHAEPGELTVYTGSPLFFPAYISAGSTNQVGYLDAYRTHTPLASLSGGWRYDITGSGLMKDEGFFLSWGWRSGPFSGGLAWHFSSATPSASLGFSFEQGGLTLSATADSFDSTLTLRTDNSWGVSFSFDWHAQVGMSVSLGFGFSRRDAPADTMLTDSWDLAIAHRGTLLEAPENSFEAFRHALAQPHYVAIETDIQMAADGAFVLIHDPVLLRYRHGFEHVRELTSEELMELDMGSWFDEEYEHTRVLGLGDLAALCNRNPDVYWLLELKDPLWDEQDALRFLSEVDSLFDHPKKIAFYVVTREMLELMQRLSGRPVGIQLDTVKKMFFYSDHLLPLMKTEYRPQIEGADFFTILSSKFDRQEVLMELAEEMRMPVMFWNFHDDIVGYIPESLASYPLGMPKMEEGTILK